MGDRLGLAPFIPFRDIRIALADLVEGRAAQPDDARGRRADGSSTGVHRSTARPSARRGEATGARRVPDYEERPGDLGIDVPEFIPN